MFDEELVSIVLPVYNGLPYLESAISSIIFQTYRNWELIIINDGSTDNTSEYLRNSEYLNDPRINYVQHEGNRGISEAYNTGIQKAHGRYIAFQEQDDISLPHRIETQVNFLHSRSIALVTSKVAWINENNEIYKYWSEDLYDVYEVINPSCQIYRDLLIYQTRFANTTSMIDRNVVDDGDLEFDTLFRTSCQDWDFHLRLVQKYSIARLRQPLVKMRRYRSHTSSTSNKTRMFKECRFLLKKHCQELRDTSLCPVDWNTFSRAWSNQLLIEARYFKGYIGLLKGFVSFCLWPNNPKVRESILALSHRVIGNF